MGEQNDKSAEAQETMQLSSFLESTPPSQERGVENLYVRKMAVDGGYGEINA
jgi:hypothetical protein